MISPSKTYGWSILFENGTIDEVMQNRLPKNQRIDQQQPPRRLGNAIEVRLIPIVDGYPKLFQKIPFGSLPVCHKFRETINGVPVRTLYRIGYNTGGHRTMKSIDLDTREISEGIEDDDGRRVQVANNNG